MTQPEENAITISTQYGNLVARVSSNGEVYLSGVMTINRIDYTISKTIKKEGEGFHTIYHGNSPSMTESARKKYYPEEEALLQGVFANAELFRRSKIFFLREEMAQAKKRQGELKILLSRWQTREALIEASLNQEDPGMCEAIDGYYGLSGNFIPHGSGRTKCSLPKHHEQVPHSFDKKEWGEN